MPILAERKKGAKPIEIFFTFLLQKITNMVMKKWNKARKYVRKRRKI